MNGIVSKENGFQKKIDLDGLFVSITVILNCLEIDESILILSSISSKDSLKGTLGIFGKSINKSGSRAGEQAFRPRISHLLRLAAPRSPKMQKMETPAYKMLQFVSIDAL